MKRLDSSFIGALQKADPTFRVMADQRQTAINATGFEVDVIRRMATDGNQILGAKRFSQVIVSETGHMAVMHTMDPVSFVSLKRKMSVSPTRDPKKRPRDGLQADLVAQLIASHMPQYQLDAQAPTTPIRPTAT